jgi:transcriptional regulator with GAF, ATPase, and Fis domain
MATLKYLTPVGGPQTYGIHKQITSLGRAPSNDLVVVGAGVAEHHVQVVFDGRDYNLTEVDRQADIKINGKRKRRARLVHGDRVELGEGAEIAFSMFSELPPRSPVAERPSAGPGFDLGGLQKLLAFSQKLMARGSIDELLEAMLDDILELTSGDKGALLLVDEGARGVEGRQFTVRAARNVRREALANPAGAISDSIVRQVLSSGRPIIVSDALSDTLFGKSESVVALQLSSVMCVPLLSKGEAVGAIYVGSNRIKHLFERPHLDLLTVFAAQAALILENVMLLSALRADKEKLSQELNDKRFGEIIGSCPSMLEIYRKLQRVASTDISVLITGETGTGKELLAREIHRRSNRASGAFVAVNCGAIPENLIESELFGHVKGAFTGAIASRTGKFQSADGGTLFLDEIGELPTNLQVKLLRALQDRTVVRVGDSKPEKIDIRVLAATNRNLEEEIKAGRFREDLYYRLNVVNLYSPPLRERGDDVIIIAKTLLSRFADELKSPVRGFAPATLAALRKHSWPGNIRELENRIKKALVLCEGALLDPEDLGLGDAQLAPILPLEKAKEEFQRRYVLEALERNHGNRTQTARDLGVDPRTIFRYLEKEQNPMPSGAGDKGEGRGPLHRCRGRSVRGLTAPRGGPNFRESRAKVAGIFFALDTPRGSRHRADGGPGGPERSDRPMMRASKRWSLRLAVVAAGCLGSGSLWAQSSPTPPPVTQEDPEQDDQSRQTLKLPPKAAPKTGKGPKPLVWAGSSIFIDQSVNTETVGVGRDYQSRNPSVQTWASFRPRINLYGGGALFGNDDPKNRVNVNFRIDATKEYANDDGTKLYRETTLGDLWVNVVYSRVLVRRNGWNTLFLGGPRALFPTSLASQGNGAYASVGGGGGLMQMIPLNRGSDWFSSLRLFGSMFYTHAFTRATTPTLDDDIAAQNPRTTASNTGLGDITNQMTGRLLVNHQLLSVIDTGLQITPNLGLTFDTIFIQRWNYKPTRIEGEGIQIMNGRVSEADLASSANDPQNYSLSIFLFTSVDYQLSDELNLSFNYYNFGNTIGPSGRRQNMFYAPEAARFSLTATIGLDALYRRFLGTDEGDGPGASGNTRVAKAQPVVLGF